MPLPFGLKLKRTRRYTVSSKSCLVARIQLLNNEFVEFTLSVESTGQESLEAVAQRLELREVGNVVAGLQDFPSWDGGTIQGFPFRDIGSCLMLGETICLRLKGAALQG